jgi:hypothetical protein
LSSSSAVPPPRRWMARLFEAYQGRKLAVGFFRTFRCVGFVKDKNPGLKKLGNRSALMVFIGYSKGAKAYACFNPAPGECMSPATSSSTKTGDGRGHQAQATTSQRHSVTSR